MSTNLNFQVIPLAEVPWNKPAVQRDPPIILVVDDERVIADTLSAILSRHGFAVMTAYNGITALELARVTPPDLLISDVAMPGMNGIELAIAMVQSLPDCKVLLFSGQASTVDLLDQARRAGHTFTLILKPIHPTDLLNRISAFLKNRQTVAMPQLVG
jgi:DNA-binding response OmpR family regulator